VRRRRLGEYTRPAEPPATTLGPLECYPDHGTAGRKRQSVGPWELKREEDEGLLRQGAWYPIVSSGVTRAVLEVSGQRVTVPQEALEVRNKRPDKFTVVYRTREDPNPARGTRADAGRRYGVCPRCATRLPFRNNVIPAVASCQQCGHQGIVAWWETG